jgi:glutathione S-transferase
MRTLYHFPHSPFSRRVRLALAHKGLEFELRDASSNPAWREEARQHAVLRTIPVLVDGDHSVGDSTAITRWLDAEHPLAPRVWPDGRDALAALEVATLVDVALTQIVDVGTRYYALRESPGWAAVQAEMHGRAQGALDALAARVASHGRATIAPSGWSAGDMWLFTMVAWIEGMPARVGVSPNVTQIVSLGGWTLPAALSRWADAHRDRPDIRSLG